MRPAKTRATSGTKETIHLFADPTFVPQDDEGLAADARRERRAARRRERETEVENPFPSIENEVSAIYPILWLGVPLVLVIVWALVGGGT